MMQSDSNDEKSNSMLHFSKPAQTKKCKISRIRCHTISAASTIFSSNPIHRKRVKINVHFQTNVSNPTY